MTKTVTVVGQGYVGLPLAQEASLSGWKVFGLDVSEATVAKLNSGESHVDDLSNGCLLYTSDAADDCCRV